jgi:group II intron reverse transcriptase/maturase
MLQVLPHKHRVHSLTGRSTLEALHTACKAVKRNRGAAGLDKQSIKMFEANVEENLLALMRELKSGAYQPIPLRRGYIPKGKGVFRPLGIPAVRCRVAQEVIRALIDPIFEPTFHDSSHGFRRHRSGHTAMAQLVAWHRQGYRGGVDAALKGFLDSIPHPLILALVAREIADGNILSLIKKFLQASVMEAGEVRPTRQGTPQGGVVSPLLANLVLNHLAWRLEALGYRFVRYADDFVVLCKTRRQAEKALQAVTQCVEDDLGLALNPDKTQLTTVGQGFVFLGYYVSARTIRMGGKAEERCKMTIKAFTKRSHNLDAEGVMHVNRVIRGTVRSFATAFTSCLGQFNELDRWIRMRIRCMKYKRIWKTDNRRVKRRHIERMGFVSCREVYLSATEGEDTDSSKGALSWGPPGA